MAEEPISRISSADSLKSQQVQHAEHIEEVSVVQMESEAEFYEMEPAFNPMVMSRRFESLEVKTKKKEKEQELAQAEQPDDEVFEIQRLQEVSENFERRNPELQGRSLLLLRARITRGDSKEEILRKLLETYPDYSLADEALDFLLETSDPDFSQVIKAAKEELNARYGREVKAGRNIGEQSREFSKQGLGSPTALRDMYRSITGNPRDATTLFEELNTIFSYDKMKSAIDFFLHSLGADMKSRGPSIARGELHRLFTETRNMQAILGVFRFFKSRMQLIESSFQRQGLTLPARLSFEFIAKNFVRFLQERYPSSEKALQMAQSLGLSDELIAQIIIYTQMRDGVRQVAPKLFRSEQHRQDVLTTFMEAIEELDDQLEEEEDKEKEDEEEEKKDK